MKKNFNDLFDNISARTKRYDEKIGFHNNKPVNNMSMNEMMGLMRNLKEDTNTQSPRVLSQAEVDREQEKFLNYFNNENVSVEFQPLNIYENGVLWGGTINGELSFTYQVTKEEKTSTVELKYLDGFDSTNPNNDKIIKMVQLYYKEFCKYWRDNELQINNG